MAKQDPIPTTDQDFDTLQGILATKVTANKLAWEIPDAEITKLTDKQAFVRVQRQIFAIPTQVLYCF